jgi:16S rRNA pseudouridine516 synthase
MWQDKKAIIFDMDGTLVDSMWMWKTLDVTYLGRFGISTPEGLQQAIEGKSFSETAVYFKDRFGLSDSVEQIKQDWNEMAWDAYLHQVPLKDGVYEFLCACKKQGIRLGIATSNSPELAAAIAKVHGLNGFISCIMTSCQVNRGKPYPDIYLAVAKELDVDPKDCLVFEDIIPGIQAGLNAGMEVCAVEDPYSAPDREQKKALAQYYIDSFWELLADTANKGA